MAADEAEPPSTQAEGESGASPGRWRWLLLALFVLLATGSFYFWDGVPLFDAQADGSNPQLGIALALLAAVVVLIGWGLKVRYDDRRRQRFLICLAALGVLASVTIVALSAGGPEPQAPFTVVKGDTRVETAQHVSLFWPESAGGYFEMPYGASDEELADVATCAAEAGLPLLIAPPEKTGPRALQHENFTKRLGRERQATTACTVSATKQPATFDFGQVPIPRSIPGVVPGQAKLGRYVVVASTAPITAATGNAKAPDLFVAYVLASYLKSKGGSYGDITLISIPPYLEASPALVGELRDERRRVDGGLVIGGESAVSAETAKTMRTLLASPGAETIAGSLRTTLDSAGVLLAALFAIGAAAGVAATSPGTVRSFLTVYGGPGKPHGCVGECRYVPPKEGDPDVRPGPAPPPQPCVEPYEPKKDSPHPSGPREGNMMVKIPGQAVATSSPGEADLLAPTQELLRGLSLLPESGDLERAKGLGATFTGPPDSVSVIEAGATAASKWWATAIAGSSVTIGASIVRAWDRLGEGQEWAQPFALLALGLILAAAVLGIAYILGSDVRGRAAAMVATLEARRVVAASLIEEAAKVYKPEASAARVWTALSPPLAVSNGAKTGSDENGWKAVAFTGNADAVEYLVVKGSRSEINSSAQVTFVDSQGEQGGPVG